MYQVRKTNIENNKKEGIFQHSYVYLSNAAYLILEADIILLFLFFSWVLSYYLSFVQQTYLIHIHSYTIIMALTEPSTYQP